MLDDPQPLVLSRTQVSGLDGHEPEQTLGDSEGQGSLACCKESGGKESDMT